MSTTINKRSKKFKTLVAILGSEEAAVVAYTQAEQVAEPVVETVDPVAQLVAAGYTQEQAEKALASAQQVQVAPLTSKERGEALVAERGLTFTKGRVYGTPTLAEAIVRVHRTGTPEVVQSSGVGRTAGVLVYKEESGDVALQNLSKPV